MRDFVDMFVEGVEKELQVMGYLQRRGYPVQYTGIDMDAQNRGIDMYMWENRGKMGVEVKVDTRLHSTGNIVIEVGMRRKTGYVKGWYYTCEADYLFYCDANTSLCYVLDWKRMQKEIGEKYEVSTFWNRFDNCIGELYILPISQLGDWLLEKILVV